MTWRWTTCCSAAKNAVHEQTDGTYLPSRHTPSRPHPPPQDGPSVTCTWNLLANWRCIMFSLNSHRVALKTPDTQLTSGKPTGSSTLGSSRKRSWSSRPYLQGFIQQCRRLAPMRDSKVQLRYTHYEFRGYCNSQVGLSCQTRPLCPIDTGSALPAPAALGSSKELSPHRVPQRTLPRATSRFTLVETDKVDRSHWG